MWLWADVLSDCIWGRGFTDTAHVFFLSTDLCFAFQNHKYYSQIYAIWHKNVVGPKLRYKKTKQKNNIKNNTLIETMVLTKRCKKKEGLIFSVDSEYTFKTYKSVPTSADGEVKEEENTDNFCEIFQFCVLNTNQ